MYNGSSVKVMSFTESIALLRSQAITALKVMLYCTCSAARYCDKLTHTGLHAGSHDVSVGHLCLLLTEHAETGMAASASMINTAHTSVRCEVHVHKLLAMWQLRTQNAPAQEISDTSKQFVPACASLM